MPRAEYLQELEARVSVLHDAIADTLAYINTKRPGSVGPLLDNPATAAVITASSSLLLIQAYQSLRKIEKPYMYKVAGITAAAILAIHPIRVLEPANVRSPHIVTANQQCALRAASALLELDIAAVSQDSLRRLYKAGLRSREYGYLRAHLKNAEKLAKSSGGQLDFKALQTYDEYNADRDITWGEIDVLEEFILVFELMELAYAKKSA